ncbi:MAG: hypothetical protein KDC98_11990, partial [Planctomycetes bacterium]|nr:hypothetical protein [Planctomycetota bacterium]
FAALCTCFSTAQVNATYAPFGAGCPGTGIGLGATHIAPVIANSAWGSGNAIPFGWTPNHYMQAFLGSDVPSAMAIGALSLRQPHTGSIAHGFTVDIEIRVGYTTRWQTTLDATFANNWDAGAPLTVLPRSYFTFPDQSPTGAGSFTEMVATIPFQTAFPWTRQTGRNLLIEVFVYGNSAGSGIYGYPLDNVSGTMSLVGTPATATVANQSPLRTFGMVMGLVEQTHTAVPVLYSNDTPQIGNQFRVRVAQAVPSSIALMEIGFSSSWYSGHALPLDLGAYGAAGCSLLVGPIDTRILFTNTSGATNLQYNIPNNIYALGLSFFNQALVADPSANALGIATSNGGHGVMGNQ